MSQSSITSFFVSRKKRAGDELISSKRKVFHATPSETKLETPTKIGDISSIPATAVVKNVSKNELTSKGFVKKVETKNSSVDQTSSSVALVSARKELSLGDIRKKLAGSSKRAEILARAQKLNETIQRHTSNVDEIIKNSETAQLAAFSSPRKIQNQNDNSSAITSKSVISPRKVVVSPVKNPSKIPAYIKYAHLTKSTGLPLPHHYRYLAELFRSMEQVVSLLYNRNERITFAKLKPSVQEMLKRNFTEKQLSQIKFLVPDFYNFEVQKAKNSQKETHELVISPNFPNDIKIMNATVVLERQRYFYDALLQLVKKKHDQFIKSQFPDLSVPSEKLVRWHPDFDLHKLPEIECSKLPELPNKEQLSTAQDVLTKARELFKCNTRMERALEKLAQAKERGLTEKEKEATGCDTVEKNDAGTQTNKPGSEFLNPHLRNLPASLIERIKAKQAAKALEAMTRSAENEQKYEIFSRLTDLARTLRNIYVTERKNVLSLNLILSKLDSSFKGNISAKSLQGDIELLAEHAPEFVKLHNIRSVAYLKLDRKADLNSVISKLETLANSYK